MKPQKKIKLGNNGEPIESEESRDIKFDAMKESQPQKKIKYPIQDLSKDCCYQNKKGECVYCFNPECHHLEAPNPQENLEGRFDKEFGSFECLYNKRRGNSGDKDLWILGDDIKQFIRQLLSEERERVIEDVKFFFCHKGNSPQERIDNLMKWLDIKEEDLPNL